MSLKVELRERFWSKVDLYHGITDEDCWLWNGAVSSNGRGSFYSEGATYLAHRMAWLLSKSIAAPLHISHRCNSLTCVNPSHLECRFLHPSHLSRFWSKVDKNGPVQKHQPHLGNCWIWIGGCSEEGYGMFVVKPRTYGAHRWIIEQLTGSPLGTNQCCHHCDNPKCVRPDHLFIGTHSDNMKDRDKKGRNNSHNASKTHCKYGHALKWKDVAIYKNGNGKAFRRCLKCLRERYRQTQEKRARKAIPVSTGLH